jgi:hypothetical protein
MEFTVYNLQFTVRLLFTFNRLANRENRKRKTENAWKTENGKQLIGFEGGLQ